MNIQTATLNETAAHALAQAWVARFAEAVQGANPARVSALFRPDGFWRDCVAMSRCIHSIT